MGHLINHANLGEVQETVYLKAVVVDIDYYEDTIDIEGIGECPSALAVPVFYHCEHNLQTVKRRENGALEEGSMAFSVDDEVVVQCLSSANNAYTPLFVIGFADKPKNCCIIQDDFKKYDTALWQENTTTDATVTHLGDAMELFATGPFATCNILHIFDDHPLLPTTFTLAVRSKLVAVAAGWETLKLYYKPLHFVFMVMGHLIRVSSIEGDDFFHYGSFSGRFIDWRVVFNGETFDVYENNIFIGGGFTPQTTNAQILSFHANSATVIIDSASLCGGEHLPEGFEG